MRDQLDPTHLRRTLQRRGQVATSTAITSVVVIVSAVFAGCPKVVGVGLVVLVVAVLIAIRADDAIERLPR